MGDEDEGDSNAPLQAFQLDLQLFAQFLVQRAERLVEEQHLGLVDQRARQGDPLLLAARQLPGTPVGEAAQPHLFQGFPHPRGDLVFGAALHLQAKGHILRDRQVREEGI